MSETELPDVIDDEVEIIADPPEPAAPEAKPEPTEAERTEARAKRKKDAQSRINEITGAKYAAEQRAENYRLELEAERRANAELRRTYLTSTDAALERDLKNEQMRLRRAISEGDVDEQVAAQAALAEVSSRRVEVQRDVQRVPQPQQRQQAPQQQFTPQTQAYIDENPWFTNDRQAQATAVRAHEIAVARGIKPDTPQYFEHVTRVVKAAHPEHFEEPEDDEEPEVEQPRRSPAPPVAAARRTVPGQAPAKSTLPGLTASEAALCKENNWDMKAYAAAKARRMKEGTL